MALGFIKKIFSFGKDDKSAEPAVPPAEVQAPEHAGAAQHFPADSAPAFTPETSAEPALSIPEPSDVEHAGEPPIVPDDLVHTREALAEQTDVLAEELREQAESIAEFQEATANEPEAETAELQTGEQTETGLADTGLADTGLAVAAAATLEGASLETGRDEVQASVAADEKTADTARAVSVDLPDVAAVPPLVAPTAPVMPIMPELPPTPVQPTAPALPAGFAAATRAAEPAPIVPERKLSWIERLRQGLSRTSAQLTSQIASLFTKRKLDDETLQDLEDLLIQADLGVETAMRITDTLASERYGKDVSGDDVAKIMASEIAKVLTPVAKPLELDLAHKPHVILVVGVNGTGKTTTIGKLAAKLTRSGLRVMLAAGDTFRAAAIEQLHIWANRTGADIVSSKLGADAAGLAYEAYEKAKQSGHDVLIIDTAGRLQNKTELMAELEKIVRVLGRLDPDAPHTVLQTLDATTGQNALNQVEIFRNVAGVSGLIMTKLDGTARGGILVAISAKHKLPVCFIGVGEGIDDLEPFNATDFAEAIAGRENK
jgi:fused signal recognition particle receptor